MSECVLIRIFLGLEKYSEQSALNVRQNEMSFSVHRTGDAESFVQIICTHFDYAGARPPVRVIVKVKDHQHCRVAGGYDLERGHF